MKGQPKSFEIVNLFQCDLQDLKSLNRADDRRLQMRFCNLLAAAAQQGSDSRLSYPGGRLPLNASAACLLSWLGKSASRPNP
jgi:hypothetical protein